MHTEYFKQYSHALERDMEMKRYGHSGRPVVFIPCQDGRFFDFENFKMTDVWSSWLENGQVQVFAIDTMDLETWSNKSGDPRWRIERHEQWMRYITDEVVPFIRHLTGWDKVRSFGCSLGATHAANLFFRFPDLFDGTLALSGIYTADYGFGGYWDEDVYRNSPVDYLAGMPADHPYVEKYNNGCGIICVGTGPWEIPDTSLRIKQICEEKGIGVWVDVWGDDVFHDWEWWYKQVPYFMPVFLR